MFNISLPWWEFIVRGLAVYFFLLFLMRIGGKKQIGQMSPFDFVLLLILSNAVQNSMNGGDESLVGGLIIAVALVSINWFLDYITVDNKFLSRIIEGKPEIIIHNGKIFEKALKKARISRDDLDAVLRQNNVLHVEDVRYAVLERSGDVSVIKKTD